LPEPIEPENRPQPVWFHPFKDSDLDTDQTPPKKMGKNVSFVKADAQTFEEFYAMLKAFGKAQGIKHSTEAEIRAVWDEYHPEEKQTPPKSDRPPGLDFF
jgi:hypothetical protein